MGHTIHLFSPETWGFHIDLVTEDNVVAPLSMKDSSHSLDPSQNSSLMYDAFRFIFPFFFYMIAQIFLLLSSCWGSPLWLFPACFFFVFFYQIMFFLLASLKHPFSLSDPRSFPISWSRIAVQTRAYHIFTCTVAWQCLKPCQAFFSVGLPSLAFGLMWDVERPGYRSVQLHTVYKQSWDFSGFQFLLDMSVLFALIKIPILLVPPHNFLLYLYCPDHIPV